ncbi:MAG: NAD(P)H-hydrate dehydratase [Chlamydiales bacterium]|nr:NAD(P)H-hydrate dehydratase [Chlamydiales bacterium]
MKVVNAKEMARIEKIAFERGASDLQFMEEAGKGVSIAIQKLYPKVDNIFVLAGKGNNAGDAYVAARWLLKHYSITVFQLVELSECSPLCQLQAKKFVEAGGIIQFVLDKQKLVFSPGGIILDGIFGTGFQGRVKGLFEDAISLANTSSLPIVAIDIPSGLNGSTGIVESVAICATWTLFLELPKTGFFIQQGFDHIGSLYPISFSLDKSIIELAEEDFILEEDAFIASMLPKIKRTRHKYQSGFVVGLTGSFGMPGAAILSGLSSLRAGSGIVKILCPLGMDQELSAAPPELIRFYYKESDSSEEVLQMMHKATAVYLGPGIGKSILTKELLKTILSKLKTHAVIDADALNIIAEDESIKIPQESILTPHKQEMDRLLGKALPGVVDEEYISLCQNFCNKKNIILVLKGAPTFIFQKDLKPHLSIKGDPGMATAGTGDVLTGIISAFLAAGLKPFHAALLGTFVHGMSGEIAAFENTSYSMIAHDLIQALPQTFKKLLNIKEIF